MPGLLPGTTLHSRYRVQRLIGEGATGAVYLVRDTRDRGCQWALKETWSTDDDTISLFCNEARMLQRLSHPALPVLQDFFVEAGCMYLVMERVEGPTLEAVQSQAGGRLPEGEVFGWAVQICEVLSYLHDQVPPIIYRDLKPANCMLSEGNRIKIVDLGISRVFNPTRPRDTQAFGTPGFCPPEQYAGHTLPASDLYALGVTVLVLLSGMDPEKANFRFPPVRALNPCVSAAGEALLQRALEHDPSARFANAHAMGEAFEGLLRELQRPQNRWRNWLRRWSPWGRR